MTEMDIRETVEEILQSPQLRHSLEATVRNLTLPLQQRQSQLPVVNRASVSSGSSLRNELHNLFPSIGQRNRTRNQGRGQVRENNSSKPTPFYKDVILVTSKRCLSTLKGHAKAKAYDTGFAFSNVEFHNGMKLEDLNNLIYSLFSDKLMNSEYEFVVPISGRLTKLSLQSGSQLNGETLKRVYHQKVVYIRPMEDLADNNSNCTPEMNNVDTPTPIDDNDGVCLTDQWHSSPTGFDVQSDNLVNSDEETNLLQEILTNINSKISLEKTNQFNVYRADVFHCCIRAIRRSSFDPFAKIDVKFSDIDGQSEGAVDMGGPTRELFRLLMNYLKNSNLFMGPDKKYISLDALALDKRYYYDAGRMVALSIVHAGLGPHFFSNSLFVAVTKGVEFVKPLKEFVECDILEKINKLSHINDETEMREYLLNESVFSIAGINIVNQLIARKDEIIDATVKFYHIYRTKPALDQLIDGLKTCNVLEFLQNHPILFEDIVCDNKSKLNNTIIEELPTVMLSEVGSNKRQTQNRILAFWRDYLLDCEEENSNCSLEELLVFVTGADTVPALGFGTKIYIRFQHDDKMMYPKANTCGLELYLPTCHTNFDDFKYHMDFGIGNSKDFGIA